MYVGFNSKKIVPSDVTQRYRGANYLDFVWEKTRATAGVSLFRRNHCIFHCLSSSIIASTIELSNHCTERLLPNRCTG